MKAFRQVRTLATVIFTVIMTMTGAAAQDLPRIAVYVTGNVGDDEKEALGTRMLASLVNSGRYKGIERSDSFLAEIEKEQVKQHSGDIDDNQISALGRQFGVKFVCIAAITPAFGEFQVSARIVDVETAQVEFIGESSGQLKSMTDLERVSDKVVENMFGEKSAQTAKLAQQPKSESHKESSGKPRIMDKKISLEIGGTLTFGSADEDGQMKGDSGNTISFSDNYSGMGAGFYLRGDFIYAEVVYDLVGYGGGGNGMFGVLGKYPVGNDVIKVFPLLGLGGILVGSDEVAFAIDTATDGADGAYDGIGHLGGGAVDITGLLIGGRIDVGITEIVYLRSEYLYCSDFNKHSAMLFKIGGGLDMGWGEKNQYYGRIELMYNLVRGTGNTEDKGDGDLQDRGATATVKEHRVDLRAGIGYKWGGKKRVKEQ